MRTLNDWRPPARPEKTTMQGRYVRLEPLSLDHAEALHEANRADDGIWGWLPYGPFMEVAAYRTWVASVAQGDDPQFLAVRDLAYAGPSGVASLMRAEPAHGVIEIGHVCFSPVLQRTRAATEAILLMADWAFSAGYRRLEWKCDALNLPSRRAAARFGFGFEGVFRQHMIVRGANRDTAWFAIVDRDWPELRAAFGAWLEPGNFDAAGAQKLRLSALTREVRLRSEAEHNGAA